MVQAIENWAEIAGEVLGEEPARIPEHRTLRILLQASVGLEGYPNLFHPRPDAVIDVSFPATTLEQQRLTPGVHIRCRARLVAPGHAIATADAVASEDPAL